MLQQRRRKATKEELAQGEREMKAAQERLDRELQTAQELPLEDQRQEALEDGKGGASQGTQPHQTPASTAAPVTEDRVQVSGPSTLRTPEVKGPKSSREGTERKEKKVEDEVKSSHPTPRTEGSRVGGKGKGERRDDEEVIPESHSIATPPDPAAPLIPLFSEEQRRGLHEMYQQAPWLSSKFETPQAIASTPMPTLSRPAFLTEEEGREASERREEEKRKMEMLRQLHERRELEEVVASKNISTLGILAKGMVLYQPGGLAERQAILSALESPAEAATVGIAITTLRRWIRWKRRAEELDVSVPDPTIYWPEA